MSKKNQTALFVLLILLLAAAFRVYGLRWEDDLQNYPHPDERHLANTMTRVSLPQPIDWGLLNDPDHSPLNPRRLDPEGSGEHYDLAYGTLPVYAYRVTAILLAKLLGDPDLDSYYAYGMIGRSITALFSLLAVLWLYRLGGRTFGTPAALLGAALLAVCVTHIQLSHFMTVDLLMSSMLVAGLLFCVRFAQEGRTRDAVGMGVMLGLSMACKFNGVTLGAGIAVAYGVAWLGRKRKLRDLLGSCVPLTLVLWVLAFGLFEFYALRDTHTYADAIGVQANMVSGETDWPYTRQYINTAPYLFQLRNLFAWGMGWPLGIAAAAGVMWTAGEWIVNLIRGEAPGSMPRRAKGWLSRWVSLPRRAGALVLLGWAIPYFAYTARLEVKFLRYMLPLVPVLCLLAADLLWRLGEALVQARRKVLDRRGVAGNTAQDAGAWVLQWIPLSLVLLPTILWASAYMRVYAQEHPWQAASRWFYENAPEGSRFTWEAWGDPVPTDLPADDLYRQAYRYRDVWMRIYQDRTPEEKVEHLADSLRQADYVVLATPRIYLSVARLPWRYPVEIRYYQLLFTGQLGYELAAKHTAYPGIGSWERADLGADQSFYDYDHPPVLIWRKTRDLTDQEWQTLFADSLQADPEPTREGDERPVHLPVP